MCDDSRAIFGWKIPTEKTLLMIRETRRNSTLAEIKRKSCSIYPTLSGEVADQRRVYAGTAAKGKRLPKALIK